MMPPMRSPILFALLLSAAAFAKPWNGITPGVSPRTEVVKKFGLPSKTTVAGKHEVLTYLKEKAIKGTVQSQFRIEVETGIVERIDVFPEPILDTEAIEKSYGAECAPKEKDGCYLKRTQDKKPPYFLYVQLGLAIFFREDGKTVQSFTFLSVKK
jgi:hypothetical protein